MDTDTVGLGDMEVETELQLVTLGLLEGFKDSVPRGALSDTEAVVDVEELGDGENEGVLEAKALSLEDRDAEADFDDSLESLGLKEAELEEEGVAPFVVGLEV